MDASVAPNRNHAFAGALLEELARAGVRHLCVCPGSRSAPLAVAAARTPGLRVWSHVDERSAAFFALGLAKASRRPVALVCTSGTAAANFLPAVIEASQTGVPLVVLTADRPPELREWGAPQTIDQVRLFGPYARLYAEAPAPEPGTPRLRHARALAARAVAVATGSPPGPVHLNLPFREPLEPTPVPGDVPAELAQRDPLAARGRGARPYTAVSRPAAAPEPASVARLAREIAATSRGVIAAGPLDAGPGLARAAARLARAAGWPLLADPTSNLRRGPHVAGAAVISAYDAFLRNERFAGANAPSLVLRLGAPLTSKPFAQWLERHADADLRLIDPDARFADPTHRASEILAVDPTLLCDEVADLVESARRAGLAGARIAGARGEDAPGPWLHAFLDADAVARRVLCADVLAAGPLFAPRVVLELESALPDGATLFVSNSMAVRDLDTFLAADPRRLRVLCNRGANGIDGIVSSALGAAAAGDAPLALLTGDLAFLHDVGGLLAAKRHGLSATIVVVNDDGGGIFSFLPIAEHRADVDVETFFTTPHGLDLAAATHLFGGRHLRVRSAEELRLALKQAVGAPGLHVVEVPVDREANVAHHRALWRRVSAALAGANA